jgi:transposase InsO family protein
VPNWQRQRFGPDLHTPVSPCVFQRKKRPHWQRPIDAITESFFATLECELLDRHVFRTHTQARTAIFDYVEGFYNTHRRHSVLGYLSPAAFERQFTTERVA